MTTGTSGTSGATTTNDSTSVLSATFTGKTFEVTYPMAWHLTAAQQKHSWGTDTTIVSGMSPRILMRVDVTPHLGARTPLAGARSEITAVSALPGYRQLALHPNTVDGMPGEYWEFIDVESGVTMRKVDQFVLDTTNRDGYAVLTQAPAREWGAWRQRFTEMRSSLQLGVSGA